MFDTFHQGWLAGQALLAGQYNGLYNPTLTGLFALFALIPYPIAGSIFCVLSIIAFWFVRKRNISAVAWLLFAPVTIAFVMGRLDILWMALLVWGNPLGLAIVTLQPMWILFALPGIWALKKNQRWWFLGSVLVLYLPAIILRPVWWLTWLQSDYILEVQTNMWTIEPHVGTFFATLMLAMMFSIPMRNFNWRAAINYLLPVNASAILALPDCRTQWVIIPLSWIVFWLASWTKISGLMALIPLLAFFIQLPDFSSTFRRRSSSPDFGKPRDEH